MKRVQKIVMLIGFLIISGYSFGQFDADLCKRITNDQVDIKTCYAVSVVTDVEGTSANKVSFSSETVKFSYQTNYIKVSDASGKFVYFTYDKIKAMAYTPATRNYESSFSIYLKD